MTTDDARVGMLKVRNLREGLMDSYEYLQTVGDPYDKMDPDYRSIVNSLYACVTHMDRISKIISDFATSKARDPKHFT